MTPNLTGRSDSSLFDFEKNNFPIFHLVSVLLAELAGCWTTRIYTNKVEGVETISTKTQVSHRHSVTAGHQGPVVQSIFSLRSLLVVKMLTVLVSTISNSQVFLLKKCE